MVFVFVHVISEYHVKWSVMTKMFMLTLVQGFSVVKKSMLLALEDKLLAMGRALSHSIYP